LLGQFRTATSRLFRPPNVFSSSCSFASPEYECPLAKNFRSFSRSRHFIGPDDDPFSVALFAFLAVVENGHN
jgi:hypothetical protein